MKKWFLRFAILHYIHLLSHIYLFYEFLIWNINSLITKLIGEHPYLVKMVMIMYIVYRDKYKLYNDILKYWTWHTAKSNIF